MKLLIILTEGNVMRYLCLWLVLLTSVLFFDGMAQKPVDNRNLEIIPQDAHSYYRFQNMRVDKISGVPIALYRVNYPVDAAEPVDMALQYLVENASLLRMKEDAGDLVHSSTRKTPGGFHIRFNQYDGEYPVYNSDIVVNINRNNEVTFVMSNYKPDAIIDNKTIAISKNQAKQIAISYLGITGKIHFQKTVTIVYCDDKGARLAQKVILVPAEDHFGDWEVLVDASNGDIFRVEDKALYSGKKVNGSGWVFDPDPLTRSGATYGDPGFSDNSDTDSDSLTAQLLEVNLLDISLTGSTYSLKGPYAEIVDWEAPFDGLFTQDSSVFHYTRGEDAFEAVNVYHHVDKSMRYINETLGFSLMPFQYTGGVQGDPHGFNGDDNSHYVSSTGQLAWGEGGVDDAEDEDVILHELGHGIHDWITNGNLSQVTGLSEGCGDYWAVSYNRSTGFWTPSDQQYNWVFQWDGHNPFWSGRITNYSATYPGGLVGQIHTDGQIWASTLMQIYDDIGRFATDSDFLEALSMTNGSTNQEDAAQAFIQADVNLFGGANIGYIEYWFTQRGYNITVPTPQITHTPLGDTEDLNGPYIVTANVVADAPLAEVKLIHGVSGVFTDTLEMLPTGGDNYSASIPGLGIPTDYSYYIFAADSMNLASTSPSGAPGDYYQFTAGPDTIAPVIIHVPLRDQAYIRWPAIVNAQISDNLGIADVTVNYYVNDPGSSGSFQMTDQGNGNYFGVFDIDTSYISVGDSILYRITATDSSSNGNITNHPSAGFHKFYIIDAKGVVLVINDDVSKTTKVEGEKGNYLRLESTLGAAADNMVRWLNEFTYVAEQVDVATSLTLDWNNYSIVIHSSGGNESPLTDANYRNKWENYVTDPTHKYLIEGGEVGYDVASSPGYPTFANTVLHSDDWDGNNSGAMPLRQGYLNHPIANHPNLLPQSLSINYVGYGDQDSQKNLAGSYVVYGTTDEPDNAGILIYDDNPNPISAQMAYFAFNFAALTDSVVAKNLIENTVEYLLTSESAAIGAIIGFVDLSDTTNNSGAIVKLDGLKTDTLITDSTGSFEFTNLYNGEYSVTVSKEGYYPYSSVINTTINNDTTFGAHFYLDPVEPGTITGSVSLSDSLMNIYAIVKVVGKNTLVDTTDDMGAFSISGVMPGDIKVIAMKAGYKSVEIDTFLNNDGSVLQIDFMLYPGISDYVFDFENDNGGLTSSGSWEWGSPASGPGSAFQGNNLWATGLAGDYGSNEQAGLITPELDLTGFNQPKLTFVHWYDIEDKTTPGQAWDGGNVKVSTDGGNNFSVIEPLGGYPYIIDATANPLNGQGAFSGTSQGWELAEFDLTSYAEMNIVLKFDFGSDGSVEYAGWYIDSVVVMNEMVVPLAPANLAVLDSNEVVVLVWDDVTKNLLKNNLPGDTQRDGDILVALEKEQNYKSNNEFLPTDKADNFNVYKSENGNTFILYDTASDTTFTDSLVTVGSTYYYYVTAVANGMESDPSDTVSTVVQPPVGINDKWGIGLPTHFAIDQNYPNPFNPVTTIRYQIPKATHVKLEIYNLMGQKIKTLVNSNQQVNYYSVTWDGLNNQGVKVASGIYLYRIVAGDPSAGSGHQFIKTNKMLLLK